MIYQTRQQQRAQEQMDAMLCKVGAVLFLFGVAGMIWILWGA